VQVSLQPRVQRQGVVKQFDSAGFYGIITLTNGQEIRFYKNDLEGATVPQAGQRVRFQVVEEPQGIRPVHIRLA
jgi:cold shock CspA family protein